MPRYSLQTILPSGTHFKFREFPKPSSILIIHQKDSWHSPNSVILPVPVSMGQDQNQLRQEMQEADCRRVPRVDFSIVISWL